MRFLKLICPLIATARAACDEYYWRPKSGDIVQKAADALGVDIRTFLKWNPDLKNPDEIHTKDVFTVSPTGPLRDAVWTTQGCTHFLYLGTTIASVHGTSVATGDSRSSLRSDEVSTKLQRHWDSSTSTDQTRASLHQGSQITSTPTTSISSSDSPTSVVDGSSTTWTTTIRSLLTSETASPSTTSNPLCEGPKEDPQLFCNPVNDGSFFTDGSVLKKIARKFCSDVGGRLLPTDGFRLDHVDDPHQPHTQHEVVVEIFRECDSPEDRRVPASQDCEAVFYRNFEECGCNGGTAGATVLNGCLGLRNHPLHKTQPPKLAAYEVRGKSYVRKYVFKAVDPPA